MDHDRYKRKHFSESEPKEPTSFSLHQAWLYSIPSAHNANPPPRIDHTATLIANEEILIIGGMIYAKNVTDPLGSSTLLPVSMNQIMLYNTGTGKWRNHTAGGNIPAPRRGHSAVLGIYSMTTWKHEML
jgi:hypothetical protein